MKTVKDCYSIYNNNTKYWLEQTFIDYQDDSEINLFLQIMNNIDKNVINYLDSYKNYLELDDNIKNNIFDRKEDSNKKDIYNNEYYLENMDYDNEDLFCKNIKIDNEDKYFYIKNKIDVYLKNIIVNNEKYDGNITQLKLKDSVIKTTITCGGLWKYNNKCGMSWKVIKINIVSNDNHIINNGVYTNSLIKKIPNFELESDPEYINKINKIR